jgi:hypothetical protein
MGATVWVGDQSVDDLTELVMVVRYEDQIVPDVDTVVRLATILEQRAYGDIEIEIQQIQAVGLDGKLADCTFRVQGGDRFDEDDWAHSKVSVTFPDGHEEFAFYKIDGRA